MSITKKKAIPTTKTIRALGSMVFFLSDVRHGIGPLMTIFLKNALNWDPARIGLALAMPDISALFFQLPAGLIADSIRRKRLLIAIPSTSIIFATLIILISPSFLSILVAQFLMGIGISFIQPGIGTITLGLVGKRRFPKRISLNETFNHTGSVISALLTGLTGYFFGVHWVFYWVVIFAFSALTSLALINPREINYNRARELATDNATAIPIRELVKRYGVIIFNISLIIYYIANGAQMVLIAQKVANQFPSISSLFIAGCMLTAELTMIVMSFLMRHLVYRFYRRTLFLTAFLMLPIRAILFSQINTISLLIPIQILDGIAAGMVAIMIPVINTDLGRETGRFNFLQGIAFFNVSLGVVFSNLLGGFIAKTFGFTQAFLFLASVAIVGCLFSFFFLPETSKKDRTSLSQD